VQRGRDRLAGKDEPAEVSERRSLVSYERRV
jgi:hypothetical protein